MPRSAWHRFVERLLPWYDPAEDDRAYARSQTIHRNAIEARIKAEHTIAKVEAGGLRGDYAAMDQRLKGR